jgi:cytochrome P450
MHYNEDVFPNPDVLDPEHWLTADEATIELRERHFVPFSRGARGCIGLNLAQAEIHIALATIVRRFRAVEVVDKDLVTSEMFATGLPKGQRVVVQRVED